MNSRSQRIVLALESSGPGGAENVVLRLADGLRARGDVPIVATLRPGWMTERATAAGHEVWIVPQRRGFDPLWIPSFARRLRRERIDVLHAHEFAMNIYGGAAATLARIPCVATLHGRNWATGQPRRVLAYRVLRRLGVRIVAVSHDLAGFLASGFGLPSAAIHVVHNGIALPPALDAQSRAQRRLDARAALGLPRDALLLIAVGNLYAVKDHANLLAALARISGGRVPEAHVSGTHASEAHVPATHVSEAQVSEAHGPAYCDAPAQVPNAHEPDAHEPDVHVAIAGRGEEEPRLRAQAESLGIGSRVHLLGLRDDVEQVMLAGDLFVQPSRSEGLPLAILEAMALALPVVATRVGGVAEAVLDGETGRLVPPQDSVALATALSSLLDDRALRERLGAAGRARVASEFTIDAMVEGYRALWGGGGLRDSALR